jgi:hypothetical protein
VDGQDSTLKKIDRRGSPLPLLLSNKKTASLMELVKVLFVNYKNL